MDVLELIRNAESAPKVIVTLSVYIESLRHAAALPDWLLRLPLKGTEDVGQRMMALAAVVHLASQNRRDRECRAARDALRVFAAATWRLREDRGWDDVH